MCGGGFTFSHEKSRHHQGSSQKGDVNSQDAGRRAQW